MQVAVDQAEIEAGRVGFGDALEEGALLDAVAAPYAADDQDFHVAGEGGDELGLGGRDGCYVIDLGPAALLFFCAGGQVGSVGEGGGEFLGELGVGHWIDC